jgi:hypothetical protein
MTSERAAGTKAKSELLLFSTPLRVLRRMHGGRRCYVATSYASSCASLCCCARAGRRAAAAALPPRL